MDQTMKKSYTGYEYKTVVVDTELEGLWKDASESLGWQVEKERPAVVKKAFGAIRVMTAPLAIFGGRLREIQKDHESLNQVELTFKRKKDLAANKNLMVMQNQLEENMESIEKMKHEPEKIASLWAYGIGLTGTIFMGGATFAILAGMTMPGVVLAVPGFAGWILSVAAYHKVKERKAQESERKITEKQEKIDNICKNASEFITI